jgi:tRNA(fMet)-specific endonuclease VapC
VARRLILDTGVLIASERGRAKLAEFIAEDDDAAIAAITVAELRTGVELADGRHRVARAAFVQNVLDVLPVEPYDVATALVHGELLAYVQRSGSTRGAHDLIVAATALATGRTVVTADRSARFQDLPGLSSLTF